MDTDCHPDGEDDLGESVWPGEDDLGENVWPGEDDLGERTESVWLDENVLGERAESVWHHLEDWLDGFDDNDACSWLMKKCLYLVVNLRKVLLDEEDLQHKNMHDDEQMPSVEGSG